MATDSGGAGKFRGGLGYAKEYRALVACHTLVSADRVRLGCYGVNGGRASQSFSVYVDPEGQNNKLGGLEDNVPISKGELIRVTTTGGGGWGNPLDRDAEAVRMDVWQKKVSDEAAYQEYGVVFSNFDYDEPILDKSATRARRELLRTNQNTDTVIIDRGPGMEELTPANPETFKAKRYS